MRRLVAVLLALGVLVAIGADSVGGGASSVIVYASEVGADAAASAEELDPGILRWLLRSRWWRQMPEQPSPTLSNISHDSLKVSWAVPESGAFEIVDYDVQYRADDGTGFVDWVHDGTATEATITGLAELTEYRVRVRAVSEVGEGEWSAPVSGKTLIVPDDHGSTRDNATPVTSLPWSGAGELERAGDRDVFRIDIDRPGQLTVYTTGGTNTYGTLTDANGDVLAIDDNAGAGLNFEVKTRATGGVYYIEVTGYRNVTGQYTLSIEFVADRGIVSFSEQHLIARAATPVSAHTVDLDGDGDPDVLVASTGDNTVGWYENLGGGALSARRVITTRVSSPLSHGSVFPADLDGDGDPDVLAASYHDRRIVWHENLGNGEFSAERVVTTNIPANWLHAVDLDGDGDADVLTASDPDDRIAWYENLGGGEFSSQGVITTEVNGASSVHGADLDGDGDADVLLTSYSDGKVAWHENLGDGTFSAQHLITSEADGASSVHTADIDGDGASDVISGSAGNIAWYANLGDGEFSSERVVTTDVDHARPVHAADLDGDGDVDLVSASRFDSKIAWYENVDGAFSAQRVIWRAGGAISVHAVDLDGDGDPDVLSASLDNKIAWYENLSEHGDDRGDTPASATIVTALPAFLHGVLESVGDRDVFRFATGRGTLRLSSNGPTNTYGTLVDADGRQLATDDDSGVGSNFEIEARVAAGVHYVEVTGYQNVTGQYTLSIEFVADREAGGTVAFSEQRVVVADANAATSVYAADLDGDGDPDMLSASYAGVAWHENLGGGRFSAQRVITNNANGPQSVHAADLDGDGDADVLSASSDDDKIAWYENLGGGEFSAQRVITTDADNARSVYAADLDGDGDADVLSASTGISNYDYDDKIAWYRNLGGGEFSAQRIITTDIDGTNSVYAADLDGDGDPDVLSASLYDDKIAWYENLGGTFSPQRIISTDTDDAQSVHAADLDGDGDVDVLSASFSPGGIAWYENLGGDFSPQRVLAPETYGAYHSVHAADLDGDGDLDVLAGSDTVIAWFENLGEGTFSIQRVMPSQGNQFAYSVYAADLDSDGDPDMLSALFREGIVWQKNLSNHGDDHSDVPTTSATLATALPVFLHGVLESAGDRDVFRFATGNGTLRVWSNGPTDTFGTLIDANGSQLTTDDDSGVGENFEFQTQVSAGVHHVEVRGYRDETGPYTLSIEFVAGGGSDREFSEQRVITTDADGAESVYAADLDGDGDPDVLSASEEDDKIAWYENLGGGEFSAQRVISDSVDKATSVYAMDLDGDGDADVLSASGFSSANFGRVSKIAWYENLGAGVFAEERLISTAAEEPTSVYAADVDGDGDADVLSASAHDDKIAWYENLGDKEFSTQRVISTATNVPTSIHAADLDEDGDADVLSASQNDDKVAWYENLGGGTFSSQRVITTDADGGGSVYAADLDGDGDADVLSASRSDDKVAWYENLGGGAFSSQRVITTDAGGAISVYAADMDGDGDPDVLSASLNDDKIAWHEILGVYGHVFSEQRVITTDADVAASVFAADVDGDGDPDVLSASVRDDKIAWYENLSGHGDDHDNEFGTTLATLATALPAFMHGTLESEGDRDVFRFATGSGTLRVHSNGPTDTFGRLVLGNGRVLAEDDDSGVGANFKFEVRVAANLHFIEVRGFSDDTGSYTLFIEFVAD